MPGERQARPASGTAVPERKAAEHGSALPEPAPNHSASTQTGSAEPCAASAKRGLRQAPRCRNGKPPSTARRYQSRHRITVPARKPVAPSHARRAPSAACVRHRGAGTESRQARPASGIAVPGRKAAEHGSALPEPAPNHSASTETGSAEPCSSSVKRGLRQAPRCRNGKPPSTARRYQSRHRITVPARKPVAPSHARRAPSAACVRHRGAGTESRRARLGATRAGTESQCQHANR